METFNGRWRILVESRNAAWDQRVVIAGSSGADGSYQGIVGNTFEVNGGNWNLSVQHNDGSGWADSLLTVQTYQSGATYVRRVKSEDSADGDYNDLVVRCEKIGPMIEVPIRPFAVNPSTLEMLPDGIFVGLNGVQFMGVVVRNTWATAFSNDTVIDISALGRQYLAAQGIQVVNAWSAEELEATGQSLFGTAIVLGQLQVGEQRRVYFKVDASAGRQGKPKVEFHVYQSAGVPDIADSRRFSSAVIFVAEVSFDFSAGEAIASCPEGTLRLKVNSIIADRRGMARACRNLLRRGGKGSPARRIRALVDGLRQGHCDQSTLQAILAILCECGAAKPCGCNGNRKPPFGGCAFRYFWLPVDFEYTVETGGFVGQLGPLPFQDPWWKVLLIILAVILLIVGAIASATGWGRSQENRVIGTVGEFSTNNVDCCLIELNGERGFQQAVCDAITGEPNQNAQVSVNAVIPIATQVAPAFVGMRVYKSGARTGLTHAVVTSITAPVNQCRGEWDDATNSCTADPARPNLQMVNQIALGVDSTFNEQITDPGDSGSLWLSNENDTRNQVVGLNHSGSDNTAKANPIQDVLDELEVRLSP